VIVKLGWFLTPFPRHGNKVGNEREIGQKVKN